MVGPGGRGRSDPHRRAPPGRAPREPGGDSSGQRAGGDPRAHAGAGHPARLERLALAARGRAGARHRRCPAPAAADRQRRLRDPQGRPRRQAAHRAAAAARPPRDGVLAQGRDRQDRDRDEPRRLARQALGQAGAAARPRPAVRGRGDHARDRAGQDDLRPRHGSGRARLREAGRLHDAPRVRPRRPPGAAAPRGRRARDRGQTGPAAGGRARVVRRDRRRHLAVLPRPDARDPGPHRRAAPALRAGRSDPEERPAQPADLGAALLPARPDQARAQPGELQGRDEAEGGRGGPRAHDRLRGPERPLGAAGGEPREPRRPRGQQGGVLEGAQRDGEGPRGRSGRREAEEELPGDALEVVAMGLHDRLHRQNGSTPGITGDALDALGGQQTEQAERRPDPYAELKTRIHHACIAKLGPQLFSAGKEQNGSPEDLAEKVLRVVTEQLALDRTPLTREERRQVTREITDDILGYGPLEPLLRDDSVTEVMVNNHDRVYVERNGKLEITDATFVDNAHLLRIIDKIVSQVGRRVDEASPMVDARLPDGSRVNAIIPPLSLRGPTMTIRKFSRDPYTMDDLINFGTVSPEAAQFLSACVRGKLNCLISGGTGTGKTTTLNALSAFVPNDERIVTIEDAAELQLQQDHVITLESRPPNIEGEGEIRIRELVRNALRMRPDRIIVGEVRGAETLDMLQAMNTGHEGSLTTIHANTPRDALSRLETLVLTAGVELPLRAIREQISSAFDLLIQISRLVDGSRRLTNVTEVLRMESDIVTLQDIFVAKPPDEETAAATHAVRLLGPLMCSGLKPHFLEKMAANGVALPSNFFEADSGDMSADLRQSFSAASYGGSLRQ